MALNKKPNWTAAATGLVLLGLGATAQPLVTTWFNRSAQNASFGYAVPFAHVGKETQLAGAIVVDLRDNVSDADVRDLNAKFGINLQPNSVEARDNRLYTASLSGIKSFSGPSSGMQGNFATEAAYEAGLLSALKHDARVEAAEPEEIFTIPEGSKADVTLSGTALAKRDMTLLEHRGPVSEWTGTADDFMRYAMMPPASASRHYLPAGAALLYDGLPGSASQSDKEALVCIYGRRQGSVRLFSDAPPAYSYRFGPSSNKPNDPLYDKQWNFPMIGVEDAWTKTRGKGVVVAVIDTGVAIGKSKKGAPCQDFNETAFVDGYNFVDKNADPYDDHGHGTHVAGTIAESTNNGIGLAGIAPEATIMPLKVLTKEGWGTSADIADAIRWAADHKANVINMSLGSSQASTVIHKAVQYAHKKGVTIVCAAGNGFGEPVGYPAAFPECIAVSSVGPTGNIAFYSSYGKEVALAAPGGDMTNGAQDGIWQNTNYPESQGGNGDDYYPFQGTSMASPHVAAVAALIESQGVHDPARVREVLLQTATPNGEPIKYGAGILSASGAVARASAMNHLKLRHLLLWGLGFVILTVGGPRRSLKLRAAMALALGLGFFAPDWWTAMVGADSAWNLLGFSALAPMLAFAFLRNGRGVKVAGTFALGVGVCLWANWNNATLPFTTATFGPTAALPWTFANLGAALAIGAASAFRAFRASNVRG